MSQQTNGEKKSQEDDKIIVNHSDCQSLTLLSQPQFRKH